jgi:hypothetical protein
MEILLELAARANKNRIFRKEFLPATGHPKWIIRGYCEID